ncbi:MAG: FAD-dependent oxidoreductase, partial [Terricaulis sp.]
ELAISSNEIFHLPELPKRLVVVGGGYIALEFASIFTGLGAETTVLYRGDKILRGFDEDLRDDLMAAMAKRGVRIVTAATPTAIEPTPTSVQVERTHGPNLRVVLSNGAHIDADAIMFATGRHPNTANLGLDKAGVTLGRNGEIVVDRRSRTSVDNIYAVGDVIGFPSLASTSMEQGRIAACHAFGAEAHAPPEFFPYGIYSVPEISTIGMTEEQVREKHIPYETGIARFRETSRGHIMGLNSGFMKMIFDLNTRRLLGVHIVGEGATELIHIGQAVLNLDGGLDYFVENTFNYPTLAEAYKIAALDAFNRMPARETSAVHDLQELAAMAVERINRAARS